MKKYSTPKLIIIILGWLSVLACMVVIFLLSHQSAEESAELSTGVMNGFYAVFEWMTDRFGHDFFRNAAHCLEYCALGALLAHVFWHTTGSAMPLVSFGVAVSYAVSDEFHQIFIPGRAFELKDIAVDSLGAAIGIAGCCLIIALVQKVREKRKQKSGTPLENR